MGGRDDCKRRSRFLTIAESNALTPSLSPLRAKARIFPFTSAIRAFADSDSASCTHLDATCVLRTRYCSNRLPCPTMPLRSKYDIASSTVEKTCVAVSVMNGLGVRFGFQTM